MIDRFDSLIEAGRDLASCASVADIYGAIQKTARTLLRSEQCLLFKCVEGAIEPVGGGDARSRGLLQQAVQKGCPILLEPEPDTGHAGSSLAAPVMIKGEVVLCFLVTHAGSFSSNDLRFAEYIAQL